MEKIITQPNCNKTDNDPLSLLFGTYQTQEKYSDHDYSHIGYDATVW
jgi:hypothetical protein